MSIHVIRQASKESNVLFNLMALKQKCLLHEKKCEKCDQLTNMWLVIGVCHHLLCRECVGLYQEHCPVCNIKFNTKHVATIEEMKASYSEIEEVVFNIFAAENGTLNMLYCNEKEDNK